MADLPQSTIERLASPKMDPEAVASIVEDIDAGKPIAGTEIQRRLDRAENEAREIGRLQQRHKKKTPEQIKKLRGLDIDRYQIEQERLDREREKERSAMRPLVDRVISKIGSDMPEVVEILSSWQRRDVLIDLLRERVSATGDAVDALPGAVAR